MKAQSMQFKFLATLIAAMLAITVFIGGLSIYEVDKFIQGQTESFVSTFCANEASQLNDTFGDMQKSVKIMESYVMALTDEVSDITDAAKRAEITEYADGMFVDVAKHTNGVIAYYLRFDPALSDSTSGLFYSLVDGQEGYVKFTPTDISIYDRDDTEHVGWFWEPYDAGEPIWMKPYHNKNNNALMISYVVPMYCDGVFIGVVGMDFDYNVMVEGVHDIKIYEHGYAHLEIDGEPIHESTPESHGDQKYLRVSKDLINGMTLVLSASYEDINRIRYDIGFKILFAVVILAALFSLVAVFIVKKIVDPLRRLTEASQKLADGDYNIEIVKSSTYEIQTLSSAFENMTVHLREHEKLQHLLAYRDSLTGLRNTTSYKVWVEDFDKEIKERRPQFGVAVLDINFLKETNDRYGHDVGNRLIISAARVIAETFKRSPVFRVGGDEFVAILQNRDFEEREKLFEKFTAACHDELVGTGYEMVSVSIAMGFVEYNPEIDKSFADVFNRADEAMYKNKREMKCNQNS